MKKIGLLVLILTLCFGLFSCGKNDETASLDVKNKEFVLVQLDITYNDAATADQKAAIEAEVNKAINNVILKFGESNTFELIYGSSTKSGTFLNSADKVTLLDELGANLMVGKKTSNSLIFDQPASSLGLVGQIKKIQATYQIK